MDGFPALFAGRRRTLLLRLIANGVGQGAVAGAFALGLRDVLDGDAGLSLPVVVALWGSVLATGTLRWLERVDAERLGQSYIDRIRLRLFDHLGRVAPERLRRIRHGALSLRFVGDLSALRLWASRGLARVWTAGAMTLGVVAVLAWLDWRFACAAGGVLALGALAAYVGAGALDASVRRARRRRGRFAAAIDEQLSRLPTIQAYARRDAEKAAIVERSRRVRRAAVALAHRSGLMIAISATVVGTSTLSVALIGHSDATHSRGTLLAALLLVSLLATPLHRLGRVFELWRSAIVAREKVRSLLEIAPLASPGAEVAPLPKGPGAIEFAQVAIPGCPTPLDAVVAPGERVLIASDPGIEASLLLWALPRLTDAVTGTIRIDGRDIAEAAPGSLRRAAVLVSESLPLLRGSLIDNLRYRAPGARLDEIDRILDRCGLREAVERMPRGLETPLGSDGFGLARAERWRLRWARALLGRPRILLFEDVDAQIQGENRDAFFAMLERFRGTVLMTGRDGADWPRTIRRWRLSTAAPMRAGGSSPATLLERHGT
ncbi:MAG: ABC transporter transmembrane domain-containing protein [Pseudomonadota bacterium]